ncbi:MAG: hypothetical protein MO852_12755, partial [Candidatus Devosia euplotis]|nr:hypothetical protein [Candidatus Devosia euplotis]
DPMLQLGLRFVRGGSMNNAIVYLIGHYGVGKLTVARALCAATDARLFDNHLANNVIFSLIRADGKTSLPESVRGMIDVIRGQAFRAIAPPMSKSKPSLPGVAMSSCPYC